MLRWVAVGVIALAGCGGEAAPAGYERWSGSGATFVYPEDWAEKDRSAEYERAGLLYIAGSEDDSARVLVVEDKGRSLEGFMAESLTWGFPDRDVSLGPRERIEVPGAVEAVRREARFGDGVATLVFASLEDEHHLVLAVATTKGATGDVDEAAILDSLEIE